MHALKWPINSARIVESRRVQERLMQGITTLQKRQDEMAGIVQIDNTPVPGATLEELQVRAG